MPHRYVSHPVGASTLHHTRKKGCSFDSIISVFRCTNTSRAHFYFVSVLCFSISRLGLNHHNIVDFGIFLSAFSFSLKDPVLADQY